MTRRHPVEDGRTTRHETFETGDPTAGVDQHVGGGDQVGHPVGEAQYLNARLPGEGHEQPLADLVVATRHADHGGCPRFERSGYRPVEVADAPSPAGDQGHPSDGRKAERAPGLGLRARLEEGGRHERPHVAGAAGPRQLRDPLARAAVHQEVEVDPGMRPELEAREVEHRGADGNAHVPVSA